MDEASTKTSTGMVEGVVSKASNQDNTETPLQRDSTVVKEKRKSIQGGPKKCGPLFVKYWEDLGESAEMKIPDVEVKFKIYRLGCFDQKEGTFYCDFLLMLDWVDESLSLVPDDEEVDFSNHFWPCAELMNMIPGDEDLDFSHEESKPKYKKEKKGEPKKYHASITMKVRRSLFCRLDYHDFPFDRQVLELTIKMLSVRIPVLTKGSGTRPTVKHPTWRKPGHEIVPEADWLPEFQIIPLTKVLLEQYGPFVYDEEKRRK